MGKNGPFVGEYFHKYCPPNGQYYPFGGISYKKVQKKLFT